MSGLTVSDIRAARSLAVRVDVVAVAASLAANVAAAPVSVGGWLVAAVAPVGLFLAIALWHRSHGIVVGGLGRVFTAGLGLMGAAAAMVSYGHLRHVAITHGQSDVAAWIIPAVVDGIAVLATLVVISAGKRLTEAEAAEQTAAAARRAARLEAERDEAERAATVEAERVEADRVERERLAELEVDRVRANAELERERLAVELDLAVRAERMAAVESAKTSPPNALTSATPPGGPQAKTVVLSGERSGSVPVIDTNQAVADYLAEHPDATQAEVAEGIGRTTKTVQRSKAWQDHKTARTATAEGAA